MSARLIVTVLTAWVISVMPAHAATIFTFGIDGTTDFDTSSIQSYSFTPSGPGGTMEFTKAIDATSPDILFAVASGTMYSSATFIAYDNVVSPQTELFRYTLTDVLFTSVSLNAVTETVSLLAATATFVPAGGATVFTFSIGGTTDFDTNAIYSYLFFPSGTGGTLTFTKDLDITSNDILVAVAAGTVFPNATFIGYDNLISPQSEVFRYTLSNILFTSVSLNQITTTETVSLLAESAILSEGPVTVPEPASGLLLLSAAATLLARRPRGSRPRR